MQRMKAVMGNLHFNLSPLTYLYGRKKYASQIFPSTWPLQQKTEVRSIINKCFWENSFVIRVPSVGFEAGLQSCWRKRGKAYLVLAAADAAAKVLLNQLRWSRNERWRISGGLSGLAWSLLSHGLVGPSVTFMLALVSIYLWRAGGRD